MNPTGHNTILILVSRIIKTKSNSKASEMYVGRYSPAIFTVNVSAATKTAQFGVQGLGTATTSQAVPMPRFISCQKIISGGGEGV